MPAKAAHSMATVANLLILPYSPPFMADGPAELPIWDAVRRELRLGSVVVKRFRQPAKNQEMILAAFQEEGWPPHIDDPLPGGDNVVAQDRLHDAIKKLNHQKLHLIRFLSDGFGQGVLWELIPTAPGAAQERPLTTKSFTRNIG